MVSFLDTRTRERAVLSELICSADINVLGYAKVHPGGISPLFTYYITVYRDLNACV